nr:HD domain-containing protein [Lachnospiraceae bacterium]
DKLLRSAHPERLLWAFENEITRVILPEFDEMMEMPQNNPNHKYNVGMHTLEVIRAAGSSTYKEKLIEEAGLSSKEYNIREDFSEKELRCLRWAALLHDVGKLKTHVLNEKGYDTFPEHAAAGAVTAKSVMRRLKFDNETTDTVARLVAAHAHFDMEVTPVSVRRMMHKYGPDIIPLLLELQTADVLAQSSEHLKEKLDNLEKIRELYEECLEKGYCVTLKELKINGSDIINLLGISGKEVGKKLEEILLAVIEDPSLNEREKLLELAKKLEA